MTDNTEKVVEGAKDVAEGVADEVAQNARRFESAMLRPRVIVLPIVRTVVTALPFAAIAGGIAYGVYRGLHDADKSDEAAPSEAPPQT